MPVGLFSNEDSFSVDRRFFQQIRVDEPVVHEGIGLSKQLETA